MNTIILKTHKYPISRYFGELGAPLHLIRVSWGAQHKNGTVYLRVWNHRKAERNGKWYVQVTDWPKAKGTPILEWAHHERVRHIQQIEGGMPGLLIFLTEKEPHGDGDGHGRIDSYQASPLYRAGEVSQFKGEYWIEIGEEVEVKPELYGGKSNTPFAKPFANPSTRK